MSINGYMINGPSIVYTDVTTPDTFAALGYTDGGVDINVQQNKGEIITDVMGPMTPQDFQDFGMTARIVAPFIAMDRDEMDALISKSSYAGTYGSILNPGIVIGENGYNFQTYIASSFDSPWRFVSCIVRPGFGTKLAVKANPFRFEYYAWPFCPSSTTNGANIPLFYRAIS